MLTRLGQVEDAIDSYRQAKDRFERQDNQIGIAATLFQLGTIAQKRPDSKAEAIKLFNESLRIYGTANDKMGVAIVLHHLGMIEQAKHHHNEARKLYKQSLEIKREQGARSLTPVTLCNLAEIELDEWHLDGRYTHLDEAQRLCNESLEISKEYEDRLGIASMLHQLYKIEYWKGNFDQAKKFYDQSEEIKREIKRQLQRKST